MVSNNITNKILYEIIAGLKAEVVALRNQVKKSNNISLQLFFNYEEVAQILRVTPEAVKTKVKRGALIRTCSDNTPLISRAELERYFKSQNPDFEGF